MVYENACVISNPWKIYWQSKYLFPLWRIYICVDISPHGKWSMPVCNLQIIEGYADLILDSLHDEAVMYPMILLYFMHRLTKLNVKNNVLGLPKLKSETIAFYVFWHAKYEFVSIGIHFIFRHMFYFLLICLIYMYYSWPIPCTSKLLYLCTYSIFFMYFHNIILAVRFELINNFILTWHF